MPFGPDFERPDSRIDDVTVGRTTLLINVPALAVLVCLYLAPSSFNFLYHYSSPTFEVREQGR